MRSKGKVKGQGHKFIYLVLLPDNNNQVKVVWKLK